MDDLPTLTSQPRDRWQRLSIVVMGAGAAALTAAIVLLVLTLSGTINRGYQGPGSATAFGVDHLLTPQASPTQALPPPSEAPIASLVIPSVDVDAPVVVRGVDASNTMETPDGPTDVAWYDFSGKPGYGSNAVFSGHVDYINYGAAVFYHLKDLNAGDIVEVHLNDGTVYKYAVQSRESVSADVPEDTLRAIIGPTPNDVVTLITCGGTFDPDTQNYDQRVIVRAQRVLDPGPGQGASASGPTS